MLKVENLRVNYGVISAVRDINLRVKAGTIATLIGARGKKNIYQSYSR